MVIIFILLPLDSDVTFLPTLDIHQSSQEKLKMAPQIGFEPTTKWLTAIYSTAELLRNIFFTWSVFASAYYKYTVNSSIRYYVVFLFIIKRNEFYKIFSKCQTFFDKNMFKRLYTLFVCIYVGLLNGI